MSTNEDLFEKDMEIIPKTVLTAQQTPLPLLPGAENVVEKLFEGDVTENVSQLTDWIAAGMLVKKTNPRGKRQAIT